MTEPGKHMDKLVTELTHARKSAIRVLTWLYNMDLTLGPEDDKIFKQKTRQLKGLAKWLDEVDKRYYEQFPDKYKENMYTV